MTVRVSMVIFGWTNCLESESMCRDEGEGGYHQRKKVF